MKLDLIIFNTDIICNIVQLKFLTEAKTFFLDQNVQIEMNYFNKYIAVNIDTWG